MVSYYNPMAMYRQQGGAVGPSSGQFNSGSPTPGWYGGYHHHSAQMQVPTPQQYLNCMQDGDSQWHHPHHSVFNHDFFDYNYLQQQQQQQQQQHHPHQYPQQPKSEPAAESQLPSPPMSSSELSSPGAATPPATTQMRPGPARSPYDWMTKPSYQSQPNPEVATLSSAPLLLEFSPQDASGKTRTKDKYRVVYTDHQRLELEKEFHFSRYITIRRKSELAASLGLSERQVKIWFQNRRAKERKQVKKRDELNSKDILNSSSVAAAAAAMQQLHQQGLLHHHHQQQQQQQQQQAVVAHHQHQTQLGGGHTTVVPVPVPLI